MKLDKNYKVRVTPEQSREIQELVFGLGGKWNGGTDWVTNETIPFLYVTSGLVMTCDSKAQEYFSYASSENTEIQADDLIALLTDLSKSAENPLQDMKLTPEFEAVEPVLSDNCQVNIQDIGTDILDTSAAIKDTPKFKVGDKVYYGIRHHIFHIKTIKGDFCTFTNGIKCCGFTRLCHATPENYERLQATFPHIEFERPPTQEDIDNEAVDKLAQAMKNKLAKKREQGYHGWETCKHGDLVQLLINHVDKGDPIDVANFCAFLFARGEPLTEAVLDE